jgi:hypothetical protein
LLKTLKVCQKPHIIDIARTSRRSLALVLGDRLSLDHLTLVGLDHGCNRILMIEAMGGGGLV